MMYEMRMSGQEAYAQMRNAQVGARRLSQLSGENESRGLWILNGNLDRILLDFDPSEIFFKQLSDYDQAYFVDRASVVTSNVELALANDESADAHEYIAIAENATHAILGMIPALERQDLFASVEARLGRLYEEAEAEIHSYLQNVQRTAQEVEMQLQSSETRAQHAQEQAQTTADRALESATKAAAAVEREQVRIAEVVDEGTRRAAELQAAASELKSSFDLTWRRSLDAQTEAVDATLAELRERQEKLVAASESEYAKLTRTVENYRVIVEIESGTRLAGHYDTEAKGSRKAGWWLIGTGFALILITILPLVWLVSEGRGDFNAALVVARIGMAVALGGAATVAIKMGSGFHRRADQYTQLSMELRTMEPFLSGVEDRASVDKSRLDLVGRTFGRSYGSTAPSTDGEAIPVSLLENLISLLKTLGKTNTPST